MNNMEQIENHETRLREAMLRSNISELDDLLSPDLIFTNHLGGIMTKQDDLAAHKSGLIKINDINVSDQKMTMLSDAVVVTVKARIIGQFSGQESDNYFRFTRVWKKLSNAKWQIIVGHASIII